MNTIAYIWRGLVNCFYLFVILYVFRTIASGQALVFIDMGKGLHEEFADLKLKMGYEREPIADAAAEGEGRQRSSTRSSR